MRLEDKFKLTSWGLLVAAILVMLVAPWLNVLAGGFDGDTVTAWVFTFCSLFVLSVIAIATSDVLKQRREEQARADADRLLVEQEKLEDRRLREAGRELFKQEPSTNADDAHTTTTVMPETSSEEPPAKVWRAVKSETVTRDALGNVLSREDFE